MNFPKLKTRPRSTHTVYRFGGLWNNDEAPVGMTAKTVMRWKDLRNLGPDKYPMMSRVTSSNAAVEFDGNIPKQPIIAAVVEGDHRKGRPMSKSPSVRPSACHLPLQGRKLALAVSNPAAAR